jgi:hypothetical protein
VPDVSGGLDGFDAFGFLPRATVVQAELDLGGIFGIHGEVHTCAIPGGSERIRFTGENDSWHALFLSSLRTLIEAEGRS